MSSLMTLAEAVLSHRKSISVSIIDNGTKVYNLHGKASALKELTGFVTILKTSSQRQIVNNFNSMPENCKNLLCVETQEKLKNLGWFQWLNEQQKAAIVSEIEQCQSKLMKSILYKELICASMLMNTQVNSLLTLSKELAQADNLVKESKGEIDRIILKLVELQKLQKEMIEMQKNIKKKGKTSLSLDQLSDFLNDLIAREVEVRRSLDQVKVNVDGKIVRLGDQKNVAIRDAVVSASQVLGNLIEYSIVGGMFSLGLSVFKLFTTSIFATMSFFKYKQSVLTSRRIQKLSEVMKQVGTLEEEVTAIQNIIFQAKKWTGEQKKTKEQQKLA